MLTVDKKKEVISGFAKNDKDTGSVEVQIGILTERIKQISEHLQAFPKDKHSRLGLIKLVCKRRRFYRYLENNDSNSYEAIMRKVKN
jgi:small subunit ribosomal protein S15